MVLLPRGAAQPTAAAMAAEAAVWAIRQAASTTVAPPTGGVSATSAQDARASSSSAVDAMKSLSAVISSASAAIASESNVAAGGMSNPPWMKWLGLGLAVGSGFMIGASFVFKKKGLLSSRAKSTAAAGEGHAYLKSFMWWTGMIMMILGEVLNLVAYAVTSAILVTPLGALSVVICAILSSIFLKEKLTLFGKVGCFLCIVGSTIIALNGPQQHSAGRIDEFQKLFLSVGFLVWMSLCIAASVIMVFFVAPKYGKKNMLVYIIICSLLGGLSVSTISGLGSAILLTIRGENQFKHWFLYFLTGFCVITLLLEINYLNKALELFNTAMVTPTYYVIFTFATLVTSIILYQGLEATPQAIMTIVLGFLVICSGITLLQLSKIDPEDLAKDENGTVGLDRGTTLLIRASQSHVSTDGKGMASALEEPGVDTVRGGLGVVGSIIRARSSRHIHSSSDSYQQVDGGVNEHGMRSLNTRGRRDLERFELHDGPAPLMSPTRSSTGHLTVPASMPAKRDTVISFASGSDAPHGHHASEKAVDDDGPGGSPASARPYYATEPAHHLAAIREASDGSASTRKLSIRPIGPRSAAGNNNTGSITRSPGGDLRTMWGPTGDGPSPGVSPSDEKDESFSSSVTEKQGADEEEEQRERTSKVFPRGKSQDRGRGAGREAAEEEELLSPRSPRDSLEEEERLKGSVRGRR